MVGKRHWHQPDMFGKSIPDFQKRVPKHELEIHEAIFIFCGIQLLRTALEIN
jgi:hypothetical protein